MDLLRRARPGPESTTLLQLLELPPDASSDAIEHELQRELRYWNPDRNADPDARARFRELKRAAAARGTAQRTPAQRPVAQSARPPTRPSGPRAPARPRAAAIGVVVGLGLGAVLAGAGVMHQVATTGAAPGRLSVAAGVPGPAGASATEPAPAVPALALTDLPAGYSVISQSPASLRAVGPVRASSDILFQHGRPGTADFTLMEGIVVRYGSDGQAASAATSQGAQEAAGGAERQDISRVLPGATLWLHRLADGRILARVIMRIGATVGVVGVAGGGASEQVDAAVTAARSLSDRLAAGG